MIAAGSFLVALTVAALAWGVLGVVTAPRVPDPRLGYFEEERRQALRERSSIYRWFEPWIDELRLFAARSQPTRLAKTRDDLIGAGEPVRPLNPRGWDPDEYLATKQVEALGAALIGVAFGLLLGGLTTAAFFGLFAGWMYLFYASWDVADRAKKRRRAIRRRLASSIELMSLMMEVGATFHDALTVVAREAGDHPLGAEFSSVLRDLSLGNSRADTLAAFADRMGDDDSRDLIAAVLQGEKLGTPVAESLKAQAKELRLKRSQWAEKAAEESKVALVFPAMLIMAACLAIVVAPFVLGAIYNPPA